MKKLKLSLTTQITIALVLAVIAGILLQGYPLVANEYIKPFGVIFLNLLKFIVAPLVLFSIMSGILSMNDMSKLSKLGLRSVFYFCITTIIAVTLGLLISTFAKGLIPTVSINTDGSAASNADSTVPTFMDQLVNMFPDNILTPFSSMAMIQIIFIAVVFGVAIVHIGEDGEPIRKLTFSLNNIVSKVLSYIISLAPFGIFCMLTPVVVNNGPSVLGTYAGLVALAYFCFFVHVLCVYSPMVKFLGGMSPIRFFKEMKPAILFAFSSDSSVATLPYTMECTRKLGVKKEVGSFVLPLGATINMDGTAIYQCVVAVFMAHCCGVELGASQYIAIAIAATIVSIGTPAVSGSSLALMPMVLASANIPVECVAVAAGIDRIVDMGRTVMSITGDASCAIVMQKMENDESNTQA